MTTNIIATSIQPLDAAAYDRAGKAFRWMHPMRVLTLPALESRTAQEGFEAGDIHGYATWALLALVGLHAAAALNHHFVRHGEVPRRTL